MGTAHAKALKGSVLGGSGEQERGHHGTDPPNLKLLRVAKDAGAGGAQRGAGLPSFSGLCP